MYEFIYSYFIYWGSTLNFFEEKPATVLSFIFVLFQFEDHWIRRKLNCVHSSHSVS